MPFRSVAIWKQAIHFYLTNGKHLLPILPLLLSPVVSDVVHSLLIKQSIERGQLFPIQLVKAFWKFIPSLLSMKLYFESAAFLRSFIPVYGIIQAAKHRLYWAMASNVAVFEELSGKVGRERCRELGSFWGEIGVRTLITVPALLVTVLLIAWVIIGTFVEASCSYGFWILIALVYWIIIPGSAAVNTFLYTEITKSEKSLNP